MVGCVHAGAGKTTLMDVIAGRKTQGEITGDILVNGHAKDQKTWSRVVGYVEQMDIHSPQVPYPTSPTTPQTSISSTSYAKTYSASCMPVKCGSGN